MLQFDAGVSGLELPVDTLLTSIPFRVLKRIVEAPGVAVEVDAEVRGLDVRVGAEEAAEQRVVQAGVRVVDAEIRQVLMSSEVSRVRYVCC